MSAAVAATATMATTKKKDIWITSPSIYYEKKIE